MDKLIDNVGNELNKKEIKGKIKTRILDPLLCDVIAKFYPYFIILVILLILIIISQILIIYLAFKPEKNAN